MSHKHQKITILISILFLLLIPLGFIFAQDRGLEVDYPDVGGPKPETVEFPITEYFNYIFKFALRVIGLIALAVLIWSGIQYFTSTGKPDVLESAKNRIKSALLGIVILLLSYLLLITINPQLVVLHPPELQEIPPSELPATPISYLATSDLLGRIKEVAEVVKQVSDGIKYNAKQIKTLANKCNCSRTESICYCTGGGQSCCQASAYPPQCYSNPCPNFEDIKSNQREIAIWKDEILHYRNRILAEIEDLKDDLEKILEPQISWYDAKIALEETESLRDYLNEERNWLAEERSYKKELKENLNKLADEIAETKNPITELSQLSDKCLINIKNCTPNCTGECHSDLWGCKPEECSGGNPCPTEEIQHQVGSINSSSRKINSICDKIISIINGIDRMRERET